jgi:peptide/nickel transport system substrate-binding protein
MRNPLGSGPFKFVEWVPGQRIVLERFDNYWKGPARLSYVVMEFISEPSIQLLKLKSGEADAIFRVDSAILEELYDPATGSSTNPDIALSIEPSLAITGLMCNLSIEPYSNREFRKALVYAMPYELIYEVVYNGIGMLPFNGMIPRGMPCYSEDFPEFAQDLDLAKSFFEEVAWTGEITIHIRSGRANERDISLLLKDTVEALDVGIQVNIVEVAVPTWKDMRREGELAIYFGGWGTDVNDPHSMVEAFYRSDSGFHASHTRMDDAVLDALVDAALVESDPVRRCQLYHQIVEYGNDQYYYLQVGQLSTVIAMRSWLKGWQPSPMIQIRTSYTLYKEE